MSSSSRRRAREYALKALYQMDVARKTSGPAIDDVLAEANASLDFREFVSSLVVGVETHKTDLDKDIEQYSEGYSVPRLAAIDRNLLRLALFEIRHVEDVPPAVAINEAVDLAKKFSTEESGAFINGVLGKLVLDSGMKTHGDKIDG